jgi:hypothetical protein
MHADKMGDLRKRDKRKLGIKDKKRIVVKDDD